MGKVWGNLEISNYLDEKKEMNHIHDPTLNMTPIIMMFALYHFHGDIAGLKGLYESMASTSLEYKDLRAWTLDPRFELAP